MSLLKKEIWFIDLILVVFTGGFIHLGFATLMNLYDEKAWYSNYKYWLAGFLCLIFPIVIMVIIFLVQMIVKVAEALEVPGKQIYNSPYAWILCLILPIIGWVIFFVMLIYITIWPVIMIYQGYGEKYLKN